jgi:hypothetical protein
MTNIKKAFFIAKKAFDIRLKTIVLFILEEFLDIIVMNDLLPELI